MTIQYLPIQPNTPDWRLDALCAQTDPEVFFPERGQPTRPAKRVCSACTARAACLRDALEQDERFGVRGGLSAQERRKLQPADVTAARPRRLTDVAVGIRKKAA